MWQIGLAIVVAIFIIGLLVGFNFSSSNSQTRLFSPNYASSMDNAHQQIVTFGGTPGESVEHFIRQIETKSLVLGLSQDQQLRLAMNGLVNNAARCFAYLHPHFEDLEWGRFTNWLRVQYGQPGSPLSKVQRLLEVNFHDQPDFECTAWNFRDLYLEYRSNANEEEVVSALLERMALSGLPITAFSQALTVRDVILTHRRLFGHQLTSRQQQPHFRQQPPSFRQQHNFRPPQPEHAPIAPPHFHRNSGPPRMQSPITGRGRCFNCHEFGHFSRECPRGNSRPGSQ